VPQILHRVYPDAKIVICEPRRLAVLATARRVAYEMKSKIGGKVGYHLMGEREFSKNTQLKYVTYGIFS